MDNELNDPELRFSIGDIERAASEGVIEQQDSERLIAWGYKNLFDSPFDRPAVVVPVEHSKDLNLVTVAYYFGAMLMISACAWFLGDKWEVLASKGVLTTTLIYA